jgi:UPF0716 protein FxsA
MLIRLAMLFILLPLVELALLMFISARLHSWLVTMALVILTGIVGAWLARREGLNCYRRVQQQMAQGQIPADSLVDGLMILVAGAVLVTPGIITDCVGFTLLIPQFRQMVRQRIVKRLRAHVTASVQPPQSDGEDRYDAIINVEYKSPDERQT